MNNFRAHDSAVTCNQVIGIGVPVSLAHSRLAAFFVRKHGTPFIGRAVRGAFGFTGPRDRHANPHGSAHPDWRQGGGNTKPLSLEAIMPNSTPSPVPGNPFHLWINLSQRLASARAVAMCVSESTEIRNPDPLQLLQLNHLSDLCGALEELLLLAIDACETLEPHFKGE